MHTTEDKLIHLLEGLYNLRTDAKRRNDQYEAGYINAMVKELREVIDSQPKPEPYAYIDDKNRLVKISGHVYFDGGFVEANRAIPDSWKTLVLVEKVGV